ncbi:MAG TPA: hypothetical protein VKE69_00245 [Planctomycetota bacterium]|nr:hypothetical protein [Planctomycetota bacterium]
MEKAAVSAAAPADAGAPAKTGALWVVSGSDDVLEPLEKAGEESGAHVRAADEAPKTLPAGTVFIVEVGATADAREEDALRRAARAHAFTVAVLPSPTIEAFARAIRGGARDVIAAPLDPVLIAKRALRWRTGASS